MECNFENCGYYTDGECNICGMGIDGEDTFCKLCKDNTNCYYKQNEKLKQDIEAYKQSEQEASEIIAELKAENERLKEEIKEVKKYQYEQEYLDKEIAELKAYKDVNEDFKTAWEELKAENDLLREFLNQYQEEANALKSYETYKVWLNNKYRKENERLKQTLQEIKAIAEKPKLFKDFSEIKTATEVEYDYAAICNELELRLHKVLGLITKTEEE